MKLFLKNHHRLYDSEGQISKTSLTNIISLSVYRYFDREINISYQALLSSVCMSYINCWLQNTFCWIRNWVRSVRGLLQCTHNKSGLTWPSCSYVCVSAVFPSSYIMHIDQVTSIFVQRKFFIILFFKCFSISFREVQSIFRVLIL